MRASANVRIERQPIVRDNTFEIVIRHFGSLFMMYVECLRARRGLQVHASQEEG